MKSCANHHFCRQSPLHGLPSFLQEKDESPPNNFSKISTPINMEEGVKRCKLLKKEQKITYKDLLSSEKSIQRTSILNCSICK